MILLKILKAENRGIEYCLLTCETMKTGNMAHKISILIATVYSKNVQHSNGDWIHLESRSSESTIHILEPVGIIKRCCVRHTLVPESAQSQYRYDGEKCYLVYGKGICEADIIDTGEGLELADCCDQQYAEQFLQAWIQNRSFWSAGQEDRSAKDQTVRLASTEDDVEDGICVSHQKSWLCPNKIDLMSPC